LAAHHCVGAALRLNRTKVSVENASIDYKSVEANGE
jgi:hypothetical protein